ncbi:MAG TPA: DUF1501 domain-containing protein [Pirellulales bacterium]
MTNNSPARPPASSRRFSRRAAIQAGALTLGGASLDRLFAAEQVAKVASKAKSVVYVFLSGGLSQLDSFDLKPNSPEGIRGEFQPIATQTPGVQICEHLPLLAARSRNWSLVRSLTHPYNEHSEGHLVMLTGRTPKPIGFDASRPKSTDWPSIAAVAAELCPSGGELPAAAVLPEVLVHNSGRVIPGQHAGQLGAHRDPWFIKAAPYNPKGYGAYPKYGFHHEKGFDDNPRITFQAPNLALPEGLSPDRLDGRLRLLASVERQRTQLEQAATEQQFDRFRQQAVSLLADERVKTAFDVTAADDRTQERYGRNQFGWSLLMARRLIGAGVRLVQVNLGNNETWDCHQGLFPNMKNFLFPPTDRALSALLDDLEESGLLSETLVVVAGEFGRTPKISSLGKGKLPGRDHWGAVQSVLLAGGGVPGGVVVGSSDAIGGQPAAHPQTPENLAATIYGALGLPRDAHWYEPNGRPNFVYHADPIPFGA